MAFPQGDDGPPPYPDEDRSDGNGDEGEPWDRIHPDALMEEDEEDIQPDEFGYYRMGDHHLTEYQYKYHFGTEEERKELLERQGKPDQNEWWPNGEIIYAFDYEITHDEEVHIEESIAKLNNVLRGCPSLRYFCITFSKS